MIRLKPQTRKLIAEREDDLVEHAHKIAQALKQDKVRQIRNILEVAESTSSWKALELFIRYQAARGELPKKWAEMTIQELEALQQEATKIQQKAQKKVKAPEELDSVKAIHLELVTRVLGHTVRWHIWDVKRREG